MVDTIYWNKIIRELRDLPEDVCKDKIAQTKSELEGYHYSPLLTLEVPGFFTSTKEDVLSFLTGLPADKRESLRQEDLSLIVYHYKLLQQLRCSDPESWDHVMALMDDD